MVIHRNFPHRTGQIFLNSSSNEKWFFFDEQVQFFLFPASITDGDFKGHFLIISVKGPKHIFTYLETFTNSSQFNVQIMAFFKLGAKLAILALIRISSFHDILLTQEGLLCAWVLWLNSKIVPLMREIEDGDYACSHEIILYFFYWRLILNICNKSCRFCIIF